MKTRGTITLLVLIFGGIFVTVLMALSGYILAENKAQSATRIRAQAFSIAEAGLEAYRWRLAHFPNSLAAGTDSLVIPDPSGGTAGTAELTVSSNTSCGQILSVDIASKGIAAEDSSFPITLVARYAQPSVARYSYIVNDSVYAGPDRVINGPYHSNGGVRMDGTANAPITSSLESWWCDKSFGCSEEGETVPGVFGAGTHQELWSYPTPQIDFAGIATNFSSLKTLAQTSGLYLPRFSSGGTNGEAYYKGYHLIFNANGTVTVRRVTSADRLSVAPLNLSDPKSDHARINNENSYNTYPIPSDCGLIFVEDNTWVEGAIPSKVTLVVANISNTSVRPDAYLKGNIIYTSADGSSGFTLISEHNILITPDAPNNMTLNGIFIAQSGAFGRNLYATYNRREEFTGCNTTYEPKGSLTILGTTVSNKRTGTQWLNGCPNTHGNAGYQARTDSFDRNLASDPPPFTPTTSTEWQFVDWQQK